MWQILFTYLKLSACTLKAIGLVMMAFLMVQKGANDLE